MTYATLAINEPTQQDLDDQMTERAIAAAEFAYDLGRSSVCLRSIHGRKYRAIAIAHFAALVAGEVA